MDSRVGLLPQGVPGAAGQMSEPRQMNTVLNSITIQHRG